MENEKHISGDISVGTLAVKPRPLTQNSLLGISSSIRKSKLDFTFSSEASCGSRGFWKWDRPHPKPNHGDYDTHGASFSQTSMCFVSNSGLHSPSAMYVCETYMSFAKLFAKVLASEKKRPLGQGDLMPSRLPLINPEYRLDIPSEIEIRIVVFLQHQKQESHIHAWSHSFTYMVYIYIYIRT